jgi:hypothetical protein
MSAAGLGHDDACRTIAAQYAGGVTIDQLAAHHEDLSASLLSDAQTQPGRDYAAGYADTARTLLADLRADEEAARIPKAGPREPHPSRPGWQGCPNGCGVYVRAAEAGRAAETDREAG